ncbi:hypothetical protein [uncultured Desulfovibrio sp.]|uniref:hypothetical protein n=1 Tax=uncultured Desulfovibrio sp. TaxID=167968 RepID=UPI002869569A|nr:hypothetical protein [uncultured Desulfovibrio sp.]
MKLEKKPLDVPDIVNMPKPRPARAGARKAVVLALLAVLALGGATYWLTRDKSTRDQWKDKAADIINNATSGTPLAGVGDVLRDAPPPPPISVVSPPTSPGTLAGQTVQGSVGAPVDGSTPAGMYPQQNGAQMPQKVTEDSHIRMEFVEDLAAFVVARFKPGPQSGTLNVSVQALNQRYGAKFANVTDGKGGREALLRYAFHPTMLRGLYTLYADRFLDAVNRDAASKGFTPEQIRQLHMALAGRLVILAGALEGVASVPNLDARLREQDKSAQGVVEINAQMAEAVFAVDQLRENNAPEAQISTAQLRVDGLSARYRRALEERAALQRTLVAAIRQNGGQTLDDDSLLFVAQWVDRRLRADAQALASVQASAGVLRDLARRSAQAGTGTPFQPQSPAPGAIPNGAGNAVPNVTPNAAQNAGHVQTSPQLTPPQGHAAPALPAENSLGGTERAPAPRVGGQQ